MANPVLNDKAFTKASGVTLAPPQGGVATLPPPDPTGLTLPPVRTGAITTGETMTVSGTIWATLLLFGLLLVSGFVGWNMVSVQETDFGTQAVQFPGWTLIAVLVGFGLVLWASFKPHLARFLSPLYAIVEGLFLGAISHAFEISYPGIVVQAVGATLAVFGVMLVLYATRVIKVTQRFRSTVIGATIGLAVFYLAALVLSLFGVQIGFLTEGSWFGILFSILAAGLAAFNLMLDFDLIERGSKAGAPAYMEWFAALGLLVTLVWLYLEMLRLLAKLRER